MDITKNAALIEKKFFRRYFRMWWDFRCLIVYAENTHDLQLPSTYNFDENFEKALERLLSQVKLIIMDETGEVNENRDAETDHKVIIYSNFNTIPDIVQTTSLESVVSLVHKKENYWD